MKRLIVVLLLVLASCWPDEDPCYSPCPPSEPQCIQVCVDHPPVEGTPVPRR